MPVQFTRKTLWALAPLSLALAACSNDAGSEAIDLTTQEDQARTVATILAGETSLSKSQRALTQTGLSTLLDGPTSYTVFAPSDAAFAQVEGLDEMVDDLAQAPIVAAMFRQHIVPGALTPDSIRQAVEENGGPVELRTLGNSTLTLNIAGDNVLIEGEDGTEAHLASAATIGSNGVLLPVDALLVATGPRR